MPSPDRRVLAFALAGVATIGLALPAISQDAPESLLPPGFGTSTPPPAQSPQGPESILPEQALTEPGEAALDSDGDGQPDDPKEEEEAKPVELPDAARRPIDYVGPLGPSQGGLGSTAFGRADGRFLTRLMRRIDAPVASRWTSILLRRALLSQVPTPAQVGAPDWIAERAWLLLRMGEADAARMLIDRVDTDRFSPRLTIVAQQVALANANPAALCPLTSLAANFTNDRSWDYARAICASLSGDAPTASMFLDRGRGRAPRTVDYLLAEKTVGAGTNSRRAATIEWNDVSGLTSWRFGLASAVGLAIPDTLYATVGPHVRAWQARAAMLPPEDRLKAARIAATIGVFSSAALVDLYAQAAEREGDISRDSAAGRLRTAYVGDAQSDRMTAIRGLWNDADRDPRDRYAAELLTARAAARLKPSDDMASDYARLIASMLSAGLDRQAARWAPLVQGSSPSVGDEAWALLAVGAPRVVVDLSYGRIDGYGARQGADGTHKVQMLIAALGGLGRLSGSDEARLANRYDLSIARETAYTRAIDRAAARGEQGTVALIAAAGMQTADWKYVPPLHLYHLVAALRRTGNEPAARMIAAEALSRL